MSIQTITIALASALSLATTAVVVDDEFMTKVQQQFDSAKDTHAVNCRSIREGAEVLYLQAEGTPAPSLQALVDAKYLKSEFLVDCEGAFNASH